MTKHESQKLAVTNIPATKVEVSNYLTKAEVDRFCARDFRCRLLDAALFILSKVHRKRLLGKSLRKPSAPSLRS